MTSYHDLIARKQVSFEARGLAKVPALNPTLFAHQEHTVDFLLRQGCGAAFLDTGMGKTRVSLEWGRVIMEATNRPVLMLAPLAVGLQHEREAQAISVDAKAIREPHEMAGNRIYITNYERLAKFDPSHFGAVILDESSVLKSFTGATTRALPGDPAAFFAGPAATEEAIEDIRRSLGLDRPLLVQFGYYVRDLFRGDLGATLCGPRLVLGDELGEGGRDDGEGAGGGRGEEAGEEEAEDGEKEGGGEG
jgi:hypothetical protein